MAISLKKFIEKYKGVSADVPWSPQYNNFRGECVSLIVRYLNECFDIPMDARGHAIDYAWSLQSAGLGYKVSAPKYGDIIVYGKDVADGYGHVQIFLGDNKAFDQNNNGDRTAKVRTLLSYAKPIVYVRMNTPLVEDSIPYADKTDLELAIMARRGDFGNGEARRNALGVRWDAVQKIVEQLIAEENQPSTPKKEYIQLSKEVERWRFYTKQPFTVGNETAFLLPSKFGGLEYEVLEKIPNFIRIKTRDYGEGYIYFDNNTVHSFVTK